MSDCGFDGCGRPIATVGYCRAHALQLYRRRDPALLTPLGKRRPRSQAPATCTGPDHKAAFARAAEAIRRGGCEPVNPADLNLGPKATWHDRMSAAQGLQRSCAATYMLDGWTESTDATIEWWVARALGHQIMGYPR